jgi:hypothetical protein
MNNGLKVGDGKEEVDSVYRLEFEAEQSRVKYSP